MAHNFYIELTLVFTSVFSSLILLALLFLRLFRSVHKAIGTRNFEKNKQTIAEIVFDNKVHKATFLPKNCYIQDHIIELSQTVSGDIQQNLLNLYCYLGFAKKDAKDIMSKSLYKKTRSLVNLRTFNYPLPDHIWDHLLTVKNWEFRWSVMEYLISSKGKKSLNWVIDFLATKENLLQGNTYHLLARFAVVGSKTIPFLLEHAESNNMKSALLKTLSIYPIPGSEMVIRSSFNYISEKSVIVAGLSALNAHPTGSNISFLAQFVDHSSWEVRVELAKNMRHYEDQAKIMDRLVLDGSFLVRQAATSSLPSMLPNSGKLVAEILKDHEHPSFEFLSLEGIKLPSVKKYKGEL